MIRINHSNSLSQTGRVGSNVIVVQNYENDQNIQTKIEPKDTNIISISNPKKALSITH